jgi:hypothetical protein
MNRLRNKDCGEFNRLDSSSLNEVSCEFGIIMSEHTHGQQQNRVPTDDKSVHATLTRSPKLSAYIECCNTTFNVHLKIEEKKEKMTDVNDWPTPMARNKLNVLGGRKPYLVTSTRYLKVPYIELPSEECHHPPKTGVLNTSCIYSYRLYELLTDTLGGKIPGVFFTFSFAIRELTVIIDDIYNAIRSKPWIDAADSNKDKLGVWKTKLHDAFVGQWNSPVFKQAVSTRLEDCDLMEVSGYGIGPDSLLFPLMEAYFLYARNGLFMCRLHTMTFDECLNLGLLNHEALLLDFVQFLRETCEYMARCKVKPVEEGKDMESISSIEKCWLYSKHFQSSAKSRETCVIQTHMQLTMNRRNVDYDVRRLHLVGEIMKLFIQHILIRTVLLNTLRVQLIDSCGTNINKNNATWTRTIPIKEEMDKLLGEIEWPIENRDTQRSAWFDNCSSNMDLCRQIIARTIFSRLSHPSGVHSIGVVTNTPSNGFNSQENEHYLDYLWTSQRLTSYTLRGKKGGTLLDILKNRIEKTTPIIPYGCEKNPLLILQQRLKKEEAVLGSRLRQYKKAVQDKELSVIKDKNLNMRMKKEGQLLSGCRKLSTHILNRQRETFLDEVTFHCSMTAHTHVCEELLVTMEETFFSEDQISQQHEGLKKGKVVALGYESDGSISSDVSSDIDDEDDEDDDGDESSNFEEDDEYDPNADNDPVLLRDGEREIDWDNLTDEEESDDLSSEDSEASNVIYSDEDCEDHVEALKARAQKKAGVASQSRVVSIVATKSGRASKQLLDLTAERQKYTKAVVLPPKRIKKRNGHTNLKQAKFDDMSKVEVVRQTLNGGHPKSQKQPKATKQAPIIAFTQTFSSPPGSTVTTTTRTTTLEPTRGILKRKQPAPSNTPLDLTSSSSSFWVSTTTTQQKNASSSNKRQKTENVGTTENTWTTEGGTGKVMEKNSGVVVNYFY